MFLSGGLEDTAACEVSLVSVLLHDVSLFMLSSQQHAVLHTVSLTHTARTWKTFTFPQGLGVNRSPVLIVVHGVLLM